MVCYNELMDNQTIQNQEITQNVTSNKRSGSKKKLLLAVVVVILALSAGGIFWFLKMHTTEPSDANSRDNSAETSGTKAGKISSQERESAEDLDKQGQTKPDQAKSDKYSRYIELPEWKIKIGIPKNISVLSYKINSYTHSICMTATSTDLMSGAGFQHTPEFLDIDKNAPGLACLVWSPTDHGDYHVGIGKKVLTTKAGAYLYASLAQAVYSQDGAEATLESKSRQYTGDILSKNLVEM